MISPPSGSLETLSDRELMPEMASQGFRVLERMCRGARVDFDPARAQQALRQAERDFPPTVSRAARRRLVQAAEALGLQIVTRQMTIVEAIRSVDEAPLALFGVSADGQGRWHLLVESRGQTGRAARLNREDVDAFLTPAQWAERIGVSDPTTLVEWLVAQPRGIGVPALEASAEPEHVHHDHVSPFQRLLTLLRPESRDIGFVILYAVAVGVLSLATPLTALAVVNTTAMATLTQQLLVLCLALFVSLGIAALLRGLQAVVVEYLQQRIFVRVVADLAYRLPRVDLGAFDHHHGPELVNRFFDVLTVQKASAVLLLDGVTVLLQMAIGLAMLAAYHQVLLGFDLFLIAGLLLIVFVLGRGAIASSVRESVSKYQVASWLEEMARHPMAFKISGATQFAFEQADLLARRYLHHRQTHFRILLRQYAFALALQAIASSTLLGLGGYLVIQGQLTLGQLVAAEIVVSLVVASFTKLGKQLESYYDLLAAVGKLGQLTDLPLERSEGVAFRCSAEGLRIDVRNLSFEYHAGHEVLRDLNLHIAPGERVAIVGPNGAGKSTFLELLTGQRMPTRGTIEVDGQDLRDVRLDSYRQHIAVACAIEIFAGTILDNLRLGREDLTIGDLRQALADVGLLHVILDLPRGFQTYLRTGGAPLSLGQAERLMLARALAVRPRLLVVDELLDEMDRAVRQDVLRAIMDRTQRYTVLVITHSDEVAALCDRQVHLARSHPQEADHAS